MKFVLAVYNIDLTAKLKF